MFQHHLLLIYRNISRSKASFLINLIGLSSGLACTLLIYLWVNDELSIDTFHEKDSRLYQVMANHNNAAGIKTIEGGPAILAETLAEEMPEVENAAASSGIFDGFTLSAENNNLSLTGQFVSNSYFDIFSYDLVEGDKSQLTSIENTIVISEKVAMTLFGTTENIIGKKVEWQAFELKKDAFVSGVFKNIPKNASQQFDFALSYETFKALLGDGIHWDNHQSQSFLVLHEGTDLAHFNPKIAGFIKSKAEHSNVSLFLQPFSDKYLYNNYENGQVAGGRIEYVRLFSLIALCILVIACINFMNLSTAKASRRNKEVGIKKAVGAQRSTLVVQYLGESTLMAIISLLLALIFVVVFLPQFNEITAKQLNLNPDPQLILVIVGITLFTGLIAGSYPSLYLSGFNAATILKGNNNGKFSGTKGALWARKGLVIFQFTISVILIVSVLIISRQINFVQTKNLGYDKDNVLQIKQEGKVAENLETFLIELRNIPGVRHASSANHTIIKARNFTTGLHWEGKDPDAVIQFENISVNYDFIETLGIEMKEGRTFSKNFGAEGAKIILNEAAMELIGFKDPIGKTVNLWGTNMQIIGIIKDFHFESLHEQVKPMFFKLETEMAEKIIIKIAAGKEKETIDALQKFYGTYNPGFTFDYKFLDDDYQAQYTAEQRIGTLSLYFSGLAILISCMGLFGLTSFTAQRRRKEIGIRKALGSSNLDIVYLLSGDFTKIVVASILIALPLSYLLVSKWLDGFAYRIELEPWYFVGAGLLALLIAWLTIGSQAIKAANINPSKCLKDE